MVLNILTAQKRDMTEQKLIWPVNMTGQYSKIILSPELVLYNKQQHFKWCFILMVNLE